MAWADIDFSKIVAGAITRGPAEVSFGEYLNEFAKALDEKLYIASRVNFEPRFIQNEIRAHNNFNGLNTYNFWPDYRSMIDGYYSLWNNYTWYKNDAFSDIINYEDYSYMNSDLINIIGQDTFDKISDESSYSNLELFTADVINSFYEIYKLTRNKTFNINISDSSNPSIPDNIVYIDLSKGNISGTGIGSRQSSDSTPSIPLCPDDPQLPDSSSDAHTNYVNNATDTPSAGIDIVSSSVNLRSEGGDSPNQWDYDANYTAAQGRDLVLYFKDALGNVLDMTGYSSILGDISLNVKQDQYLYGNNNPVAPISHYAPYDANYNQIEVGDPSERFDTLDFFSSVSQESYGTVKKYTYSIDYQEPNANPPLCFTADNAPPINDPWIRIYENKMFFDASMNISLVDINNPALDYYIAP